MEGPVKKKPKSVGTYEAKTHLPALLSQVARGEKITITKHGVPIALLVPYRLGDKPDVEETIRDLRAFRKTHSLGELSIRDLIQEGRRF
jgi:prevent-host-death family protein